MGYGNTTTVVYGVRLSPEDGRKLYEHLNTLGTPPPSTGPYPAHEDYAHYLIDKWYEDRVKDRYFAVVMADDTDGRTDDQSFCFEDGNWSPTHVFGVHVAARGYGGSDQIERYIKSVPQEAKDTWDDVCVPLLRDAGLSGDPDTILVNQVD